MIRLKKEEIEYILKIQDMTGWFTARQMRADVQIMMKLYRRGIVEKRGSPNEYRFIPEMLKKIINGEYEYTNQCVVCGKFHEKETKTCSVECNKILCARNQTKLPYIKQANQGLVKQIEDYLKDNDYPMYMNMSRLRYEIKLPNIGTRELHRALYATLEANGYVRHTNKPHPVYIREDKIETKEKSPGNILIETHTGEIAT